MVKDLPQGPFRVQRPFGSLYGEVAGKGPALVFAHGLGGNHMSWWRQVAHFRSRFTCIAFAHRGFAPSDAIAGGPHPSDYAEDLLAILDHFGIEKSVIVGQSMGGWTAISFALAHTARLHAIVMACTTGPIDYRQSTHSAIARLESWKHFAREEIARMLAAGVHPACGMRMAQEQPDLELLYQYIDRISGMKLDKNALLDRLFASRTLSPQLLAKLALPILFIGGGEDPVIPACGVEAVAAAASRGQYVEVAKAGHSVYFERAAEFNAIVEKFLAESV